MALILSSIFDGSMIIVGTKLRKIYGIAVHTTAVKVRESRYQLVHGFQWQSLTWWRKRMSNRVRSEVPPFPTSEYWNQLEEFQRHDRSYQLFGKVVYETRNRLLKHFHSSFIITIQNWAAAIIETFGCGGMRAVKHYQHFVKKVARNLRSGKQLPNLLFFNSSNQLVDQ